jgi:hypothetical protein
MDTLNSTLNFDNFDPTKPQGLEIKPPFPYIEFNWHNGFAAADKTRGAMHFGGWQISDDNAASAIGLFGKVYGYFGESTMWAKGKGDGEYPAASTRFITAAPIATRVKWYDGNDEKKGSSKTQVLVYLAEIDKDHKITPYGAAFINCGSYHSGKAIREALQAWSTYVNQNRVSVALGSIPAWAFWGYYGTFGDKRITREVGRTEKNIIVPCQVNFPKDVNNLRAMYIGDDIAQEIMILRVQAKEWLDDAKKKVTSSEPVSESVYDGDGQQNEPPF